MKSDHAARWAVATGFLVNGFLVGSWAPQIPLLASRFSLDEGALGLLILVVGCGAVAAMPLGGYLITRFGSHVLLRISGVLAGLSFAGLAFAETVPTLVLVLLAFGGLLGAMDVSMNANAITVERRLKRAIMSSSHGFWSLGGFIGAGTGGLVLERWGYGAHAVLVALVSFSVFLVALAWIVRDTPAKPTHRRGERLLFLLKPRVYVMGFVALFCMLPEGAVLDWAALYIRQEMGADIALASLAFAAFSGAMAITRFTGDRIRNRFGAVCTLRWSAAIAGTGMVAGGLASSPLAASAAFAVAAVGIANMVPIVFSAAGNQPGISPGAGMSIATTIGYSGLLVAPSIIGVVAERTGFAPIFIALGAVLFGVFFLARLVYAADRIAHDDPAVEVAGSNS